MCSPQAASAGAQSAGTAYGTVGSYYAAKAQKSALEAQAYLDDTNAKLSELSAQTALIGGQKREQNSRLETAALKGKQRAGLAASGVALGEGSAVNVLTSTDVIGEIDANNIATDAISQAWGYRAQGTNYATAAIMKRGQAKGISPISAALGTLITGAGQIAQSNYLASKYSGTGSSSYNSSTGSNGAASSSYRNGTTVTWNR